MSGNGQKSGTSLLIKLQLQLSRSFCGLYSSGSDCAIVSSLCGGGRKLALRNLATSGLVLFCLVFRRLR